MGAVIEFRAACLRKGRDAIEQDAIERRLIVSDLRSISGDLDTIGTSFADMEANLDLVSRMLGRYVDDLRTGSRHRRRIMQAIEAIEATMRDRTPATPCAVPVAGKR